MSLLTIHAYSQSLSDTIPIREVTIIQKELYDESAFTNSKLDSFALKGTQRFSLSELLNQYSNIYVKSTGRGTLSTASFRGTGASHTKVLWNGMLINSPMLGQVDLSLIPVCFLDDVTLYAGGSSLIQGSGALGGIISLENKPGWYEKTGFSISNEFASYSTYNVSAKLNVNKDKWISKSRSYFNSSANDYKYLNTHIKPNETERLQDGSWVKSGLLQEFYYRIRDNDLLSVRLMLQHTGRNLPQPMSYEGMERKEYQEDRNISANLSWKHYGLLDQYELNSAWIKNGLHYNIKFSEPDLLNMDSESREKCFINRFNYLRKLGVKTKFGAQVRFNYYQVSIREKVRSEGYQAKRFDLSTLFNIEREITDRINTYFLVRNDISDSHRLPIMASGGFAFRVIKQTELWLKTNFSRNYHVPSLNDLYWIPGGNSNLKPEESYTADLSANLTVKNEFISFSSVMSGYFSRIDDWIRWKPTQYGYWSPENIALVFSRGLEFSFKSVVDFQVFDFMLRGNYNLNRTTNEDPVQMSDKSKGKQLVYIPVHTANMHFSIYRNGLYLNYSMNLTGKRFTQSGNENSSDNAVLNPYLLNDLLLGKEIHLPKFKADICVGIYNILNTSYQVIMSRPMPGRNYSLVLELSF
jgi:iron complex outermembrane receptor protein